MWIYYTEGYNPPQEGGLAPKSLKQSFQQKDKMLALWPCPGPPCQCRLGWKPRKHAYKYGDYAQHGRNKCPEKGNGQAAK